MKDIDVDKKTGLPNEGSVGGVATPPTRGRGAFVERYRKAHPDLTDDPNDDDMWDYGLRGWDERDEISGKYDVLNGANEELAKAVGKEPRTAKFIAMIANGEDPLYALGSSYGNLIDELDEDSLDMLREGQKDYNAHYESIRKNFGTYKETLKSYGEENGLSEEDLEKINDTILDIADALNEGSIPMEVIDNVWKGMDYDSDKSAQMKAAELAGRNGAMDEMRDKKRKQAGALPDIKGGKTNTKRVATPPKFDDDDEYVDYASRLKPI